MPKRKATAAQLRNLAKGRKKLAAMRKAGKRPVRKRTAKKAPRRRNPNIGEKATPREYSTIRLRAKNDASGNPRRIFIALAHGNPKGVFDEGYSGEHAIPDEAMRRAYIGLTIDVTPSEYNYWKKASKEFKENPAYGNFMNARNVLRTGRTTNPARPRKKTRPGLRGLVLASLKPGTGRVEFWSGKKWGTFKDAMTFTTEKSARYAAVKRARRSAIGSVNKAPAEFAKVLRGES